MASAALQFAGLPTPTRRRDLVLCGAVFLVVYAGFLALPWDGVTSVLYHVPTLVIGGLIVRALRRSGPRERGGLILLSGMVAGLVVGDALYSFESVVSGQNPAPSIGDLFYYGGYIFGLMSLVFLVRPKLPMRDVRWLLDSGIAVVAIGVLGWEYLVVPRAGVGSPGLMTAAVGAGYPLIDLVLLVTVVSRGWTRADETLGDRTVAFMASLTAVIMTDCAFTVMLVEGAGAGPMRWLGIGWLAARWLLALAIASSDQAITTRHVTGRWNIGRQLAGGLPYLAALTLAVVGLLDAGSSVVLPAGAIVSLCLLFARQWVTLRENRLLVRREVELAQVLGESENFAQSVLAHLRHGLVVVDTESRVVDFNPFLTEITGIAADGVVGKRLSEIPAVAAAPWLIPAVDRAVAGEGVSIPETPFEVSETGLSGIITGRVEPLRSPAGSIVGALCLLEEVSEKHQAEQAFFQAQRIESLGVLAGGIAHDFNNLLTAILGSCGLLKMSGSDVDARQEATELIEAAAIRGADVAGRLLAFAKGGLSSFETFDLRDVVTNVAQLAAPIVQPNIEVAIEAEQRAVLVQGARGQMEQMLLNMILNSRDAMPAGGLIQLSTAIDDSDAVLKVSDNGRGMDAETQRRIFEPFFTTKSRQSGTGLGLAMAFTLVKAHAGDIGVRSRPCEGTTFTVRLPLAPLVSR